MLFYIFKRENILSLDKNSFKRNGKQIEPKISLKILFFITIIENKSKLNLINIKIFYKTYILNYTFKT